MGFDHTDESTPAVPPAESNNEQLSVKISHGNEIRRVTLPQTSFASLAEHTASLFGLPQANINIKYEDDDGDKISMSSDIELHEALRLSKAAQKLLRLFVELKALPKSEATEPSQTRDPGIYLGPQGGRFGLPPKQHSMPPAHMHPHPPGFVHHPIPPGFSPADFRHHHPAHFAGPPGFIPAASYHVPTASYHVHQQAATPTAPQQPTTTTTSSASPTQATPTYTHESPSYFGSRSSFGGMESDRGWGRGGVHHGPDHRHQHRRANPINNSYFGPQTAYTTHTNSAGTWGNDCSFDRRMQKESMRKMRDQLKEMKVEMKKGGAATEEDKRKFRAMKEEMKNEMKFAKKDAMLGMKAMKLCEKKQRLVARHVEDVTIPDGTELPPNTPFIKTWKIRNEGPAWPTGSQLLFVSHKGDNLNGPERVVIKGEVLPGQEVEVSVPLITPGEPGRYVGYYRMVTPDNVKFGQRVWVSFVVTRPTEEINMNNTNNTNNTGLAAAELAKACDPVDQ